MNILQTRGMIVFLLMLLHLDVIYGCSCDLRHPQDVYCDSDFVLKVRVKSVRVEDNEMIYGVRVKRVFRCTGMCDPLIQKTIIELHTSVDPAACGVDLILQTAWLVTGHMDVDGHYNINFCGFNRQWITLTRGQKVGVRRTYGGPSDINCDCNFIQCSGSSCGQNYPTLYCEWDTSVSCYYSSWSCKMVRLGMCAWRTRPLCP